MLLPDSGGPHQRGRFCPQDRVSEEGFGHIALEYALDIYLESFGRYWVLR